MEPQEIDSALDELENRLDRLRSLYEQYFMGIEKIEPNIPRKDVDRRFWILRRTQIRNTARRFRLQTLTQRYNTFQQHWTRICREIENGTYTRHLLKAQKNLGFEPKTWAAKKRLGYFRRDRPTDGDPAAAPADAGANGSTVAESGRPDAFSSAPPGSAIPSPPAAARATPEPPPFENFGVLDLDFDDAPTLPPPARIVAPRGKPPIPARPASTSPQSSVPTTAAAASPAAPSFSGGPAPRPPLPARAPSPPSVAAKPPLPPRPATPLPPRPASALPKPPVPRAAPVNVNVNVPVPVHVPESAAASAAKPATPSAPKPVTPSAPKPAAPPTAAAGNGAPKIQLPEPRPAVPARASPAAKPASPAEKPASPAEKPAGAGAGLSDARVQQLHAELAAARQKLNQTANVSVDSLAKSLRETESKLREQHGGRSVDFQVIIKDGKPIVKPVVRR